MKTVFAAVTAAAMALFLVWTNAVFAQGNDPRSVVDGFIGAMNKQDASAALALFAENGSIQTPREKHSGQVEVASWLNKHTDLNIRISVLGELRLAGDKVSWTASVTRDDWRAIGIASVATTYEAVVQGGKIRSLTFVFNPEDDAKLRAAQAAPRALPRSGGAPFSHLTWLLALSGAGVLCLGLALRGRRSSLH